MNFSNSTAFNADVQQPSSGGSSSGGGGGSSGGNGGGGGGGDGGGGATFVCNMDWNCGEWSVCINGLQTRQCDFVKVPQHVQDTECPSLLNAPLQSQKCELPKQTALVAETCNDRIKNQNEESVDCGGVCKPCEEKNLTGVAEKEKNQLTGFAVKNILGKGSNIAVALLIVTVVIIFSFAGFKLYRRRQQKQQ